MLRKEAVKVSTAGTAGTPPSLPCPPLGVPGVLPQTKHRSEHLYRAWCLVESCMALKKNKYRRMGEVIKWHIQLIFQKGKTRNRTFLKVRSGRLESQETSDALRSPPPKSSGSTHEAGWAAACCVGRVQLITRTTQSSDFQTVYLGSNAAVKSYRFLLFLVYFIFSLQT